ncbi:MAG TPA: polysaccharide lyase family protein, partial [Propionibacteriaceae bacterium]|nr:polysaccharide lyase family protein [Propionibacteriaceae bacterium]
MPPTAAIPPVSRRTVLGAAGAAAVASVVAPELAVAAPPSTAPAVSVTVDGSPLAVGTYSFPSQVDHIVLDNGLVRITFGRDDAVAGIVTGWSDTSISATSVLVAGREIGHNLNGVDPRDPDRQHSFYVDEGGGKTRLVCTQLQVLRSTPDLVEVAFVDTTSPKLHHEHHLIMRRGRPGLYAYDIVTAAIATSINEVRMNARFDRSILDHCYNGERGVGQQPTYAYLATQERVGDETWRVDGVNNPNLPSPDSNSGHLPPGTVYSKYNWSLYHHEFPMFGHFGHGIGAWFTPLGGVTDQTLAAFYGVGPQHQDLAIHQDALILNYFGANHYGLPSYPLSAGYRRLYGPWYTFFTVGDPAQPDAMIAQANQIARAEIAENRAGASWVADSLYPAPAQRTTVTGRLQLTDGRPAGNFWVLLSTQDVTDVYTIHEPTYFVRTDAGGRFSLPGIPPAWVPGTSTPGTYTLYVFAADGSVTDQYKRTGVTVGGATQDLGTITWTPTQRTTFLWQIGRSDRTGGEFALATLSPVKAAPRAYEKPSLIPGTLDFTIGSSWEPTDWYYAQTQGGTWTIRFPVLRPMTGTGYLTVSSSLQAGSRPTVLVNGQPVTGSLPANNDSTIGRQADRSGYFRKAVLTFPASLLAVGENTITLTRGPGVPGGNGMGWDTLVLEADERSAPGGGGLSASVAMVQTEGLVTGWDLTVTNTGSGPVNDVRITGIAWDKQKDYGALTLDGRDPSLFPVPVSAGLLPGQSVTVRLKAASSAVPPGLAKRVVV